MSLHTGQETRPVVVHELGRWYVTKRGVRFRLYEPPHRIYGTELHGGDVELADGTFTVLAWGPETKLAPAPSFVKYVWRRLLGKSALEAMT